MDTTDADLLVQTAQRQLDEHKEWLIMELSKEAVVRAGQDGFLDLIASVRELRLRVVRAAPKFVTVVYDYPDELYAYLVDPATPAHLRDSLARGHVVNPDQPASTAVREGA